MRVFGVTHSIDYEYYRLTCLMSLCFEPLCRLYFPLSVLTGLAKIYSIVILLMCLTMNEFCFLFGDFVWYLLNMLGHSLKFQQILERGKTFILVWEGSQLKIQENCVAELLKNNAFSKNSAKIKSKSVYVAHAIDSCQISPGWKKPNLEHQILMTRSKLWWKFHCYYLHVSMSPFLVLKLDSI